MRSGRSTLAALLLFTTTSLFSWTSPLMAATHTGAQQSDGGLLSDGAKLSEDVVDRVRGRDSRTVRLIVQATGNTALDRQAVMNAGGIVVAELNSIEGYAIEIPANRISTLASQIAIKRVSVDRQVEAASLPAVPGHLEKTTGAADGFAGSGSSAVTGKGISIAVLDSGIFEAPDFAGRVIARVDFTGENAIAGDAWGHGTHVAGVAAGGRQFSDFGGIAPEANLVDVRVLGSDGRGSVSSVIAGIEWVVRNAKHYNIRVVNLSLGGPVAESYKTDPLCRAVEKAYRFGIVVVAAAGNYGKTTEGVPAFGTILSPGNDPSVLTVGASNTFQSDLRADDLVATYSSHGPTARDFVMKPDLVAPGNKIISVAAPGNALLAHNPQLRVSGTDEYMLLSGTSVAAPVVAVEKRQSEREMLSDMTLRDARGVSSVVRTR